MPWSRQAILLLSPILRLIRSGRLSAEEFRRDTAHVPFCRNTLQLLHEVQEMIDKSFELCAEVYGSVWSFGVHERHD